MNYLYWCFYNNRWDAICHRDDIQKAFDYGESWMHEDSGLYPVAVTSHHDLSNGYTLEYYRDCSPDLLNKLLSR